MFIFFKWSLIDFFFNFKTENSISVDAVFKAVLQRQCISSGRLYPKLSQQEVKSKLPRGPRQTLSTIFYMFPGHLPLTA